MQQALEQRLASLGLSLKDLPAFELDGDFPQIWVDRPWHPQTRKEIYALILVTKRLSFTFPRLVLEKIAFWIQLIELCKDFRKGTLFLQLVVQDYYRLPIMQLGEAVEIVTIWEKVESLRWSRQEREQILPTNRFEEREFDYGPMITELAYFLDKKDRYRIPTDPELRGFLQQLRQIASAPVPTDDEVDDDFYLYGCK